MVLSTGTRLGPFEIVAAIGAGGMGEVYRARDSRLGRDVAIKVLPSAFASAPDRLRRFEQEARATAALNHPNILAIHDVGTHQGVPYLVEELLEGESLAQRLAGGPLPVQEALDIAAQVARGLAAAHEKGIIHRDLKPGNVFLTTASVVKILDFGLAKLVPPDEEVDRSALPTETEPHTVLGTVGYMAPEQVRGEPVDHRTDIFAFGCLLYEMLSGRRAFGAGTAADTLSAILRDEPPELSLLCANVPSGLAEAVRRCLAKPPGQRFQSAADLAFALRAMLGGAVRAERAATPPAAERPSIAVLPFANLSADPEQEFFCDGVAEEIIHALAHVEGLHVLARTSSFALKGTSADVREIGGRFGVSAVLEGSVRRAGDRLRVTAQLIDVTSGYHLWSERFDRRLEDVFAIQDEIALAVVENLEVRLIRRERAALRQRYTGNLDAHTTYLRGRYEWNRMVPEGFARSRELFEEAIRLDPGFASAHVALANWYLSQAFWAYLEPSIVLETGFRLVDRALSLDPESAEARVVRGNLEGFSECHWDEAEAMLRSAIALAPSLAEAHLYLGGQLMVRGRLDEAETENRLALRLDPVSPTTGAWAASWLAHSGARDEGIGELERLIAMYPDHWLLHWALAHTLTLDRPVQVREEAERAVTLSGGAASALAMAACLCHMTGDSQRGELLRDQLRGMREHSYVAPTLLAWVELARGEKDAAIALLEEARRTRDPMLPFTRIGHGGMWPADPAIETAAERLVH